MIKNSHFADFEQVKKLVFISPTLDKSKINLMTWDKSKITNSKTPVGETGYLCICFLFRPPFFVFLNAQVSSFLIHSDVTYGTPCHARGHLHSLTCDLQDAMPHQRSLTLIPREAEDPQGDNHSKHVPLPPYLA